MSDPLSDHGERARPGAIIFVALFLLGAVVLLAFIGSETKFSARGSLVAQPRFWPGIGVGGMVVFGALHLWTTRRGAVPGWVPEAVTWARSLEYLVWFMAYVFVVPIIGYLLATLVFTMLLALRQGYRDARSLSLAGLSGLAIVLIFKTGLSVRIPGGQIYESLPSALRNFMIVNF